MDIRNTFPDAKVAFAGRESELAGVSESSPALDIGIRHHDLMEPLRAGQKIWVEQADGSQRPGVFVAVAEGTWFGGSVGAYVAYPDSQSGEQVAMMRIVARDDDE